MGAGSLAPSGALLAGKVAHDRGQPDLDVVGCRAVPNRAVPCRTETPGGAAAPQLPAVPGRFPRDRGCWGAGTAQSPSRSGDTRWGASGTVIPSSRRSQTLRSSKPGVRPPAQPCTPEEREMRG